MRRIVIVFGWIALAMTAGCGVVAGIEDKEYVECTVKPSAAVLCDPAVPSSCTGKIVALSASNYQTCAINDEGKLWCWSPAFLEASGLPGEVPQRVILHGERAVGVSVGGVHGCAVTESGRVFCWGENFAGALGVHPSTSGFAWSSPRLVALDEPIRVVASGAAHTCAVSTCDRLYCWGANYIGQAGVDPDPDELDASWPCKLGTTCTLDKNAIKQSKRTWSILPSRVAGIGEVDTVTAVLHTTCALTRSGDLYCWGSNCGSDPDEFLGVNCERGGQLGLEPSALAFDAKPRLQALPGLKVTAFGMSHASAFAIVPDLNIGANVVYGWGSNDYGQIGTSECINYKSPEELKVLRGASQLVSSEGNAQCALVNESFWCWGENEFGELGTGLSSEGAWCGVEDFTSVCRNWSEPTRATRIPIGKGVLLALGSEHACVALPELTNAVKCWGSKSMLGPDTSACDDACSDACTESLRVDLPQ
jgi:alpha-tubulin suppressor-like RCC1 family protein